LYLKFTTLLECQNVIKEIDKRMGLNSNITATFAIPQEDIEGNYVIPKPKQSVLNRITKLVRDITITNEEGTFDSIEIVKKVFDENGNDVTEYDGSEYELVQQEALHTMFSYVEVESVELPIVEEGD
jgi:hypothetical protein